ncbi:MAG: Abi family protein [Eubacteriales bacterium]|nr:Abi family protein [Eubacteriales bacterium]
MDKKKFLSYEEQIKFLKEEKKLCIEDEDYAKKVLFKTGYFALVNGYKETFKNPETNQFRTGVRMEDIYALYCFDANLRNVFMKYILIVEQNVKSSLSYHFCDLYGSEQQDYLNTDNYDYHGKKIPMIQGLQKIMSGQLRKDSDYAYIRHYMKQYGYVPLWVLFQVLTLGQMSKVYASQKGRVKIKVCQDFGNIKINEMEKMLAVMTKFRNVCAHNDRLFDFRTKDAIYDMDIHQRMKITKEHGRYLYGKNDLFAQMLILKLLLSEEDFKDFYKELSNCFRKNPVNQNIYVQMGFPDNWRRIAGIKKFIDKK